MNRLVASALRLITAKGKSITYSSITAGVYDPALSSASGGSVLALDIKAIVTDSGSSDLTSGTLIDRNNKNFLIAAAAVSFVPEPNDLITLDGHNYAVYAVSQLYAGDVTVTYSISAKRA